MIAVLIPCLQTRGLAACLEALLPQLERSDRILLACMGRRAGLRSALGRVADRSGDDRVRLLGARERLVDAIHGDYLVVLGPGEKLRSGGLKIIRSALRRAPGVPCLRIPPPGEEASFLRARRRLFGVPLAAVMGKPLVLHRQLLTGLGSRGLVGALARPGERVWLAMEQAGGRFLAEPVVRRLGPKPDPGPPKARVRAMLSTYVSRRGLRVGLRSVRGGIRLEAERPLGIDVELTARCNAECSFCPRQHLGQSGDMSEEVFERVLSLICEQPFGTIYFIGRGEPLVHPRFFDYIRRIRESTGVEFEVFTNGLALTRRRVNRLVELNDGDINIAVNVSLHSLLPETHRRLTGTDLGVISRNLKYLQTRSNRLRVSYAFVTNKVNEEEMDRLRKHLDRTGNRSWDISLVYNKGGFVQSGELFDDAFYQRQVNWDPDSEEAPTGPCWYSYSGLYYWVNYRGEFTLCHDDFLDETLLGRVGTDDLDSIHAKVLDLRERGGADRCQRCNKRQREWHHGGDQDPVAHVKRHGLIPARDGAS